jgi:Flp pilus assembly protein TadG
VERDPLGMLRNLAIYFRRRARSISRFRRARQGATAVEFALIAAPFLATLIAIFETTIFLFAQAALQNAATEAGRLFMTGQAQNGGWTASTIQSKVCPLITGLFTCGNLIVIVQNYTSFAAATAAGATSAPQLYSNGQPITSFTYSPGTPGDVMVVQLVYKWSVVGGPLGFTLSNLPNSTAELMGVSAFRVEPY